ncbi:MAG: hypothetical protein QXG65_04185 [Thermoplasmata archaeon]
MGCVVLLFGILGWASPIFSVVIVGSVIAIASIALGTRALLIGADGICVHRFTETTTY